VFFDTSALLAYLAAPDISDVEGRELHRQAKLRFDAYSAEGKVASSSTVLLELIRELIRLQFLKEQQTTQQAAETAWNALPDSEKESFAKDATRTFREELILLTRRLLEYPAPGLHTQVKTCLDMLGEEAIADRDAYVVSEAFAAGAMRFCTCLPRFRTLSYQANVRRFAGGMTTEVLPQQNG
jgi:hypothetical protein